MKTTVAMLAATLLFVAGCGTTTEKGGPGTKTGDDANKFALTLPSTTTSIKQGTRETVKIDLKRGSKFTQPVKLSFVPPTGVTVTPADAGFKETETETSITVEAAADATPGESNIEVKGTAASGEPVDGKIPIKITKP